MKPSKHLAGAAIVAAIAAPATVARAQGTIVSSTASGWVGVSVIQHGEGTSSRNVAMGYPVVASVEPGSPAQSAGLAAGDTIVAYNETDAAANPLGYRKLLVPGERITFKVKRNGVREIAVTVAKRSSRNMLHSGITVNSAMIPPGAALAGFGPVAIATPIASGADAPLAGAQLARLNPGLASALNVQNGGVLVIDVADGSPAESAGLEAGDVIVKADSIAVITPLEIVRAMRDARDKSVALDVIRKGKPTSVTLHW